MGVRTKAGETQFTRVPLDASSSVKTLAYASRAALALIYIEPPTKGYIVEIDEMKTIELLPLANFFFAKMPAVSKTEALKLIENVREMTSSLIKRAGESSEIPVLCTNPSRTGNAETSLSISA